MGRDPRWNESDRETSPLSAALRALPEHRAPSALRGQLMVLASRESARRRTRASWRAFASHLWSEAALWSDNLMKPFAVPFAGGFVSAMLLFAAVSSTMVGPRTVDNDVPTGLSTVATLQSSFSFSPMGEDIVVDVWIDEEGRMIDYSIPAGQRWSSDPGMVRNLENTLLCTKFKAATLFGQPAAGRARITVSRNHLDVRG